MSSPAHRVAARLFIVAVLAAVSVGLGRWRLTANPGVCSVLASTGHPCPGCGSGRSLSALLEGDPLRALGYRPFTLVAITAAAWRTVTAESGLRWQVQLGWPMLLVGVGVLSDWILWLTGVLPGELR